MPEIRIAPAPRYVAPEPVYASPADFGAQIGGVMAGVGRELQQQGLADLSAQQQAAKLLRDTQARLDASLALDDVKMKQAQYENGLRADLEHPPDPETYSALTSEKNRQLIAEAGQRLSPEAQARFQEPAAALYTKTYVQGLETAQQLRETKLALSADQSMAHIIADASTADNEADYLHAIQKGTALATMMTGRGWSPDKASNWLTQLGEQSATAQVLRQYDSGTHEEREHLIDLAWSNKIGLPGGGLPPLRNQEKLAQTMAARLEADDRRAQTDLERKETKANEERASRFLMRAGLQAPMQLASGETVMPLTEAELVQANVDIPFKPGQYSAILDMVRKPDKEAPSDQAVFSTVSMLAHRTPPGITVAQIEATVGLNPKDRNKLVDEVSSTLRYLQQRGDTIDMENYREADRQLMRRLNIIPGTWDTLDDQVKKTYAFLSGQLYSRAFPRLDGKHENAYKVLNEILPAGLQSIGSHGKMKEEALKPLVRYQNQEQLDRAFNAGKIRQGDYQDQKDALAQLNKAKKDREQAEADAKERARLEEERKGWLLKWWERQTKDLPIFGGGAPAPSKGTLGRE